MKIVLVLFGDLERQSGGYLYDRYLVAEFRAAGHVVTVVGQRDRPYFAQRASALLPAWRTRVMDAQPDLVIVDELNHASTGDILLWFSRRGIVVVGLVHHLRTDEKRGVASWVARGRERRFLLNCDAYIANSETTLKRIHALVGDNGRPSRVVFPGGDRFAASDGNAPTPGQTAETRRSGLCFVGNVTRRKGVHTLVRAMAAVDPDASPSVARLDIFGGVQSEPRYVRRIRSLITRFGLDERVTLHGRVDESRLRAAYRSSVALVVPSAYEGFGIVYLEAMREGCIPVAGRLGGASEIIRDGADGLLVLPGNTSELAEVIIKLGADERYRSRMKACAVERAAEFPGWTPSMVSAREFVEGLL